MFTFGPAVEMGTGSYPGPLLLVEGRPPALWRRLPEPSPGAVPAPSADSALLERTLRERIPDGTGATEAELAAAQDRLGMALPDEVAALYRVTRGRWQDWGEDYDAAERAGLAIGFGLFPLEEVSVVTAASRPCSWLTGATAAVATGPDDAVQGLIGSPGWIVIGDSGGGDAIVVDLTPGPAGHLGQVIMLDHERDAGADLLAGSLTDLIVHRRRHPHTGERRDRPPVVAWITMGGSATVATVARPELEVLTIGVLGEPVSLRPLAGLPRLRTLVAARGALTDPLEIAALTGLEFLELGPAHWRVLLDAGAVPRGLAAAAITTHGSPDPLEVVAIANELLALWDRPLIVRTDVARP